MSNEPAQVVEAGKVVSFSYTLTNTAGQVLDQASSEQPFAHLQGSEAIVPGLERSLEGHQAGDSFSVEVSPEDGYGERVPSPIESVPRSAFPKDFEVQAGMPIMAQNENGEELTLWITGEKGGEVTVDTNHPLAGETLHFAIEVIEIRDATDEEKSHGHAHGAGGHDHH